MDIFADNRLYPEETKPLLQHFSPHFDAVYIALIPFFKLNNAEVSGRSKASKKIVSFEKAQQQDPILNRLSPGKARVIYSSDESYPSDEEIYQDGDTVTWRQILENTIISDYKQLNKALMTSIGALRHEFQTPEVLQTLNKYTGGEAIFQPPVLRC